MAEQNVPYALAMVLCDYVYREDGTNKQSILGTFDKMLASKIPALRPKLAIYLALTDGRGKQSLTLKMIDELENHPPVFQFEGEVDFVDPLRVLEVGINLENVPISRSGLHRVQLIISGQLVIERKIQIIEVPND